MVDDARRERRYDSSEAASSRLRRRGCQFSALGIYVRELTGTDVGGGERTMSATYCTIPCDNSAHRSHKIYVGGPEDGQVRALLHTHPSDFPLVMEGVKRNGRRARYERDLSGGTDVVYRFTGYSFEDVR
jgi:hypothetical protein